MERLTHEESAYLKKGHTLQVTKIVYNRLKDGNKPNSLPVKGTAETRPLLVGKEATSRCEDNG